MDHYICIKVIIGQESWAFGGCSGSTKIPNVVIFSLSRFVVCITKLLFDAVPHQHAGIYQQSKQAKVLTGHKSY